MRKPVVAVNCTVTPNGVVIPAAGFEGSYMRDGPYRGRCRFHYAPGGRGEPDEIRAFVSETAATTTRDSRLHWIPSLQLGFNFSITPGPPDELSFFIQLNILDSGVNPRLDYLRYDLWDDTTTFTVDFSVNPGAFTWSASSLPDNSFQEDVNPFTQDVTDPNTETTVLVTLTANRISGNVELYRELHTFQFALTGSSPTSSVIQYQRPGTAFG